MNSWNLLNFDIPVHSDYSFCDQFGKLNGSKRKFPFSDVDGVTCEEFFSAPELKIFDLDTNLSGETENDLKRVSDLKDLKVESEEIVLDAGEITSEDVGEIVSEDYTLVYRCMFKGCKKSYASTDAVRKHARCRHGEWVYSLCPAQYSAKGYVSKTSFIVL